MRSQDLLLVWGLLAPAASAAGLAGQIVVEDLEGNERPVAAAELEPDLLGPGAGAILRLERTAAPVGREEDPARATLVLSGGERLRGAVAGGGGETLSVELAGSVPLDLSIEDLVSVVWEERVPSGRAIEAPDEGDRLYWRRGSTLDKVDGTLEELTDEGVRFDSLLGAKVFPWDELAAVYLEPLGDEPSSGAERSHPVAVDLWDGGRLRGDLAGLAPDGCVITLSGGRQVALPLDVVAEVSVDDGSLAWLSDRAPARALEPSPFGDGAGMRWPHRMDQCVTGGPLSAGGRTYARGIGVHAPSLLEWELDGSWRALRGTVALDDVVLTLPARADASVEFRVWLDRDPEPGADPAWSSGVLRAGAAPLAIGPVDLRGVHRLLLEVDMADRMHMGDRADWLRVRLVR